MNAAVPNLGVRSALATPGSADPRVAFFDQQASRWDDDLAAQTRTLDRLTGLRERLGLRAGMDVLEVGCGTGQITGLLVDWTHPGRVTALDFSPAMLARARAKGIAADFLEWDICVAAPTRSAFDVALCFHSFPHFRDRAAALRHLAASLKPGGRLWVVHLAGSAEVNAFHQQAGAVVAHDLLPAADEWAVLLGAAGLRPESCEDRADQLLVGAVRPC